MRFASSLGIQHNGAPKPNTTNAEGHPAFSENLKQSIARVAFTGVLADSFYGKEQAQAKEFIPLCLDASDKAPRFLLNAAKVSRRANFKLFPKLALAALISNATAKTWETIEDDAVGLLSSYNAGQLLELALVFKAKAFGKGLGSRAQRILGRALSVKTPDQLETLTLSDRADMRRLLRLLHPKGLNAGQINILSYVLGDEPKAATERQSAMLKLAGCEIQGELISKFNLPFNATKGVANQNKATWAAIRDNMSPLQILLNLKAMDERGVMTPEDLDRILGAVDVAKTRMVPHDILRPLGMTYEMTGTHVTRYRETLTNLLAKLASAPIPGLEDKRVGILLDFSGSMAPGYQANSLGNWVLAVTLATPIMAACPNRHLAFFGFQACFEGQSIPEKDYGYQGRSGAATFPYLKGCPSEAAFHNLLGLAPNQGTDVAAGIDLFRTNSIPLDVLFLFTDEQQNGEVSGVKAWNAYRATNPKAKLVVVNVSNTKWHLAQENDPSITTIQSITPLIFRQFSNFSQSSVDMIEHWSE